MPVDNMATPPANITALAAAITAATDREHWEAVSEQLASLTQALRTAPPGAFAQADLQAALSQLQTALAQASSRRDEIGHLLTALGK